MSQLNSLLASEAVDLHARASDWRDAISQAGKLLEHSGAITADYTAAMITSVEDNGPYIVVAPGFAFAHARPSAAVKRTAISWVRLEEPIEFGHDHNDPVNLVVALAAQDDKAHTQSMKELAKLLGKKQARAQLDSVTTIEELREVLESVGTKKAQANDAAKTVDSKGKVLTVCGNGLERHFF